MVNIQQARSPHLPPPAGHYQQFENQIPGGAGGFNEFSPNQNPQFDSAGAGIFAPKAQYYQQPQASPGPAPQHGLEGRPQDWSAYPTAFFPLGQEPSSSFVHGAQSYGALSAYDYQQPYVQDPMFGMANGFGVGVGVRPPTAASPHSAQGHPEAAHGMGLGAPMLDEALSMLRSHDDNSGAVGGYPGGLGPGAIKRKPGSLDSLAMDQQPSSSTSSARGRPRSKKSKKAEDAEMEEDGSLDGDDKVIIWNVDIFLAFPATVETGIF
jgi:hypothetical protein